MHLSHIWRGYIAPTFRNISLSFSWRTYLMVLLLGILRPRQYCDSMSRTVLVPATRPQQQQQQAFNHSQKCHIWNWHILRGALLTSATLTEHNFHVRHEEEDILSSWRVWPYTGRTDSPVHYLKKPSREGRHTNTKVLNIISECVSDRHRLEACVSSQEGRNPPFPPKPLPKLV